MSDHVCHNAARIESLEKSAANQDRLVSSMHDMTTQLALYTQKTDILHDQMDRRMTQNEENRERDRAEQASKNQEQGERIGVLEKKPAEKWDKAVWIVIAAILTGVAGLVLGHFL